MEEKLVSVIVPIYNKEKYLKKCLDSLRNQTYRELEILLVDDGSTDKSLEICRSYSEKDERIRVLPKENEGVASARNLGIRESRGAYLSFVDPDDYVHPEYVERLKKALEEYGAEIAYSPMIEVWEGRPEGISVITDAAQVWDAKKYNWFDPKAHTVSCSAVYRRACIGNVLFEDGLKIGEDTLFLAKCIRNASKLVRVESQLYFYYHSGESMTRCGYFTGKLTEMDAWQKIVELYAEEPLIQKTAKAGYAQVCRELVVKYSNNAQFMQEGYPRAKTGFYLYAGEMMRLQLREKRYRYWAKTMFSYFFWDLWVRKKQGQNELPAKSPHFGASA